VNTRFLNIAALISTLISPCFGCASDPESDGHENGGQHSTRGKYGETTRSEPHGESNVWQNAVERVVMILACINFYDGIYKGCSSLASGLSFIDSYLDHRGPSTRLSAVFFENYDDGLKNWSVPPGSGSNNCS
jgi:hypothetical protein